MELEGKSAVRFTNVSGRGRGGEGESGVEDGGECGFSGVGEEGIDRVGVVHCVIFLYTNTRWRKEEKDSGASQDLNIAL